MVWPPGRGQAVLRADHSPRPRQYRRTEQSGVHQGRRRGGPGPGDDVCPARQAEGSHEADVSDTLGWIYIKKNLSDEAVRIFRDLVKEKPTNPTYHYHLAIALFQKGDRPGARQECDAALKNNPSKDDQNKIKDLDEQSDVTGRPGANSLPEEPAGHESIEEASGTNGTASGGAVNGSANRPLFEQPAVPYVAPFAAFIFLLAIQDWVPLPQTLEFGSAHCPFTALLGLVSRSVIDLGMSNPRGTVLIGLGVFVLWVRAGALFPGYRQLWPFHNPIVGAMPFFPQTGSAARPLTLALRSASGYSDRADCRGAVLARLADAVDHSSQDFEKVPFGAYSARALWLVALLFAAEHGPYWDVGLMAGIVYNAWMCRASGWAT